MEIEVKDKLNIDSEITDMPKAFVDEKFQERGFFTLGQNVRSFWPHDVTYVHTKLPALTLNEWGLKNNEIIFELKSSNWVDPYSFYFQFYVQNNSGAQVQLDDSVHSLFSAVSIYVNGVEVERMNDYPLLSKVFFDMALTDKERAERAVHEGFAHGGAGERVLEVYTSTVPVAAKPAAVLAAPDVLNVAADPDRATDPEKAVNALLADPAQKVLTKKVRRIGEGGYLGVRFRMPLLSRFFGQRIEQKNWRLLPMRDMKLTVKLTTNKYGFFRPYHAGAEEKAIDLIKIVKPQLCFTEYLFSSGFDEELARRFGGTALTYDFLDYEILDKYTMTKETPDLTLKFHVKEDKQAVRGLMAVVLDSSYLQSSFARPLAYVNMGFSRMQIFTRNGSWPNDKFFEKWEVHNESSPELPDMPSVKGLLAEIKAIQHYNNKKKLENEKTTKVAFSEAGLVMKHDYSHLIFRLMERRKLAGAAQRTLISVLLRSLEYGNLPKNTKFGACKTMLTVKFDNLIKNNDRMICGIPMTAFQDYVVQLKKNEGSTHLHGYEWVGVPELAEVLSGVSEVRQDVYKTVYLIAQVYRRVTMSTAGEFKEVLFR